MDKTKVIETLNEIKNTPIAPQKSKLTDNSDNDKYHELMTYNAMLDNITIGAHTNTTINYQGIDWTLRILTFEESVNIRKEIYNECKNDQIWEKWYADSLEIRKVIALALTPSPFKIKDKAMFTEKDLLKIPYDVLEGLYTRYMHFVHMALQKPEDMTQEQIDACINIAKKKPEALREFDRPTLLRTAIWFLNYSQQLEKMLNSDIVN